MSNHLTEEQVKEIPRLIQGRLNSYQIAERFNVSRQAITRWIKKLRDAGYKIESQRGRPSINL